MMNICSDPLKLESLIIWVSISVKFYIVINTTFWYTFLVKNLLEGTEYDVQVLAKSIDDQQAVSDKLRVLYPGFKSIRAISTG